MQPTQISDLRVEKTGSILRLFLGGQVLTRKEIESLTRISYGTISIILRRLLAMGLLERTGKESSNGGRRADTYRLVPDQGLFGQISVTSSGFLWSIRDLHGTVLASGTLPDDRGLPIDDAFAATVANLLARGQELGTESDIESLGVTLPGHYRQETDSIVQPSHPRIGALHIEEVVGRNFDGHLLVESDVNAAALVEISANTAPPASTGTMLYVGVTADGVGSSIIVDGSIHYGATGHAGEIHMIPVTIDGETRRFGDVADANAVAAYLESSGAFPTAPSYHELRDLIASNDRRLSEAYDRIVAAYSQALYVLDSVLDPDRIILAGVYCGFGQRWSRDVAASLRDIAEPHLMDDVVIVQAQSPDDIDRVGMWRLQAEQWFASIEITA